MNKNDCYRIKPLGVNFSTFKTVMFEGAIAKWAWLGLGKPKFKDGSIVDAKCAPLHTQYPYSNLHTPLRMLLNKADGHDQSSATTRCTI